MSARPTTVRVFGSSLVANPYAPAFRPYVYGGTERVAPVTPKPSRVGRACAAEGCVVAPHAKGFCSTHYRKVLAGKPLYEDKRRSVFNPDACGTTRGYFRHRHYNIPLCDPCREAKNTYDRARRAGKKATA